MTVQSILADAFAVHAENDSLGQTVTYNGIAIQAYVMLGRHLGQKGGDLAAEGQIKVSKTDVPSWEKNHPVLIDSKTWKVSDLEEETPHSFTLNIIRDRRPPLGR
jgi:hypothetical protein